MDLSFSATATPANLFRATDIFLRSEDLALQVYLKFFISGALGALANLLVRDNALTIPRRVSGRLVLGCLGPMFVGGVVGAIADGNCAVAALSGYVGSSVLDKFIPAISSQDVTPCDAK